MECDTIALKGSPNGSTKNRLEGRGRECGEMRTPVRSLCGSRPEVVAAEMQSAGTAHSHSELRVTPGPV